MAHIKSLGEMTNSEAISQELTVSRISCAFCFKTLDPNDPNLMLRKFVTIQQRAYHELCWSSGEGTSDKEIYALTVLPPSALVATHRIPVVLHAGPTNAITDKPVGISIGVVEVDSNQSQTFSIRNNSEVPQVLDHKLGLAWAYLDFDIDGETNQQIILKPYQVIQATLYPHIVRPSFSRREIPIKKDKAIEVSNPFFSYSLSICLISFVIVAFIHLRVVGIMQMQLANQHLRFPLQELISLIISGTFVASWFVFIQPGRILWSLYTASCSISTRLTGYWSIIDQVVNKLRMLIENRIVPHLFLHPYMLILFSIICGGAIFLALLPPFLLIIWLFNATGIPWMVLVTYSLLLLTILNISLQDYDIALADWFRLTIRKAINEIRRHIP